MYKAKIAYTVYFNFSLHRNNLRRPIYLLKLQLCWRRSDLLGGFPRSLVPGKVESIGLGLGGPLLRILYRPIFFMKISSFATHSPDFLKTYYEFTLISRYFEINT
jgi:hypothetical protein